MTLRPEHIEEALNKKTFDEIDPDEVLKHYGYKPEEVRCNGVGIGVWRKEEAFQKLGDIGAFMRFVDHKAKARIEFNYDPDFPAALLITHAATKTYEMGLEFNREIEIVEGRLVTNRRIKFKDYKWECPDPTLGG